MTRRCYDTSVLIGVLRGHAAAVRLLRAHEEDDRATTVVSAYELAEGATRPEWRRDSLGLLETLEILPLDSGAAWVAGEMMRDRRRAGQQPPLRDLWIGVIARKAGCTLYTTDRRFPRIEGLALELV